MAQPNRGCLDGFTLRTARTREARAARTVPHVFSQQQSGFPLTDGDLPGADRRRSRLCVEFDPLTDPLTLEQGPEYIRHGQADVGAGDVR